MGKGYARSLRFLNAYLLIVFHLEKKTCDRHWYIYIYTYIYMISSHGGDFRVFVCEVGLMIYVNE